jgi:membrane-associated phospholipid phosphatase
MGAIAGSVIRPSPKWMHPLVWPLLGALAGTRIVLLAHYFTDVLAGWTIGLLINRTVAATFRAALLDRASPVVKGPAILRSGFPVRRRTDPE